MLPFAQFKSDYAKTPLSRRPWHLLFASAARETAPPGVDLEAEVAVSGAPQRVDLVIRRRPNEPRQDDKARMMRPLWPRLGEITLVEYKSPTRGYRSPDLWRLCGYGLQYCVHHHQELKQIGREALTLVLIVTRIGRALREDAAFLQLDWQPLEPGYYRLLGNPFALYVVSAAEAAETTDDDWLRLLVDELPRSAEIMAWYDAWMVYCEEHAPAFAHNKEFQHMRYKMLELMKPEERMAGLTPEQRMAGISPEERLAGIPRQRFLASFTPEERLAGLPPEERLAGLPPEERLAGLSPEEEVLALSDQTLRILPADYIDTLPAHVQRAIRKRLA